MRFLDFTSWHGVMTTVLGLALFMLMGMGMRVLMMMTVQQRQQRMNRQINERLRTLIAAYKVLGGSFTGMLEVDPRSRRKYREAASAAGARQDAASETPQTVAATDDPGTVVSGETSEQLVVAAAETPASGGPPSFVIERRIQMRNAVEAALSDVLLLGTEEHVRLASMAAAQLAAGHPIQTAELVVSLRSFIRKALGLDIIPSDVVIPAQGPTRPSSGGSGSRGGRADGERTREGAGGQGGGMGAGGMGGGGMGMGMGMGMGSGMGRRSSADDI